MTQTNGWPVCRVEALLAQQDAAQLDGRVAQGVALDGVGGPAIEEDRQVDRARDLVGQAGELAVAVGPLPPLRLADLHLAEDDLVAAQRLDPQPGPIAIAAVGGQEEEARPGRPVDPHDIVRRECRRGKAVRSASGESSSTALTNSGRAGSRQFGQTPRTP